MTVTLGVSKEKRNSKPKTDTRAGEFVFRDSIGISEMKMFAFRTRGGAAFAENKHRNDAARISPLIRPIFGGNFSAFKKGFSMEQCLQHAIESCR